LFSLAGIGWPRGLTLLLVGGPVFAWLQFAAYQYAPLVHGAIINPPAVTILSTIAAAVFLKERSDRQIGLGERRMSRPNRRPSHDSDVNFIPWG
jgi:hypothetical protein